MKLKEFFPLREARMSRNEVGNLLSVIDSSWINGSNDPNLKRTYDSFLRSEPESREAYKLGDELLRLLQSAFFKIGKERYEEVHLAIEKLIKDKMNEL